jgi:hypothetical protein
VAGSPGRRAAEAAVYTPLQPEGETQLSVRRGTEHWHDRGAGHGRAIRVDWREVITKRRRRSRWERGTHEPVSRGEAPASGSWPARAAAGISTRVTVRPGDSTTHVKRAT